MKTDKFIIIFSLIIIIVLIGGLTNYKKETLYCSKKLNECHVQKTNLFNMKSKKKIVEFSDIKKVSYIRQKVKGNLYAKGYTDYQLIFVTQDNSRKIIFSEVYFEYPQIAQKIKEIKREFDLKSEEFVINKD